MHEKKEILKDSTIYISSQYYAQLLGIIISFATKRFLGPTLVGVTNIISVILGYCDYATLGVSKAAFREIPQHRGRGDFEKVDQVKNEVFTFSIIMAIFPALGFVAYSILSRANYPLYFSVGFLYIGSIIIAQRFYDLYTTLLRADKKFMTIGKITVISATLNLILTFLLVQPFKIYGFYAASTLSTLIGILYVHWQTKYQFKFAWDFQRLRALIGIGIPLVGSAFLGHTFKNMDKILIAKFLGLTALGTYSIATMVQQYVLSLPNMIAIVLFPRLQEKFAQRNSSQDIHNYLSLSLYIAAFITCFLIGLSILVVPLLIDQILPKFTSGVLPMKTVIWSTFFFAISQQANLFLITLDKQWQTLPIIGIAIALVYFLGHFFLSHHQDLQGIAIAVNIAAFFYSLALIGYATAHFASWQRFFKIIVITFSFLLYFFTLTWVIDNYFIANTSILSTVQAVGIYLLISSVPAIFLNRRIQFLSTLTSIVSEKIGKIYRGKISS